MAKAKLPPGTWFERQMFESKAYLALNGCASKLLVFFLGKRHFITVGRKGKERKVCDNCDSLTFTYIEAQKRYGITKPRFSRGIDDLLEKGFIMIVRPGGAWQQDKTEYALVEDWKTWEPGMVFYTRTRDIHRGFQGMKKATG